MPSTFKLQLADFRIESFGEFANSDTVLVGEEIQLIDLSTREPREWAWSFENGIPDTSNLQNPTVVYARAGIYDISLTTKNPAGQNTKIRSNYVIVVAPEFDTDTLDNRVGSEVFDLASEHQGIWGYVSGHNSFDDIAVAEEFADPSPFKEVSAVGLGFEIASGTGSLKMNIWNDNNDEPRSDYCLQNIPYH